MDRIIYFKTKPMENVLINNDDKVMELIIEKNRSAARVSFLIGLCINLFGLGIAIGILAMS